MAAEKKTDGRLLHYHGDELFYDQDFPLCITHAIHPASFSAHTHDFAEIVLVLNGQSIHQFRTADGRKFPCGIMQGDVLLLRPGEIHAYSCSRNLSVYNIIFNPSLLNSEAGELRTLPGLAEFFNGNGTGVAVRKLHLPVATRMAAQSIIDKILQELTLRKQGYRTAARVMLAEFMVLVGRESLGRMDSTGSPANILSCQQAINRAIVYMESHHSQNLSLKHLAEHVHLSATYFAHLFKRHTGMSPVEYLIRLRVEKAKTMLAMTDIAIAEIAFETGFCDSCYLAKLFKRQEGVTPGEFRVKLRGNKSYSDI